MEKFALGFGLGMLSVDERAGYEQARKEVKALLDKHLPCDKLREELRRWVEKDEEDVARAKGAS